MCPQSLQNQPKNPDRGSMPNRLLTKKPQQGMVLIILAFILGLAATAYLVQFLSINTMKAERARNSVVTLAEAKSALIGWSVKHQTMPGVLPCPDIDNDGSSDTSGTNCTAYIGRLPWRTLGVGDMRDNDGECLWYALSPVFRHTIPTSLRVSFPLNSNTVGTISLKDSSGNSLPSPPNPVIAVIISAGSALAGQDRTNSGTSVCGGNLDAANYLDAIASINNATGNNTGGNNYTFVLGTPSTTFNDRIDYITSEQLYLTLRKRIANEIRGVDTLPTSGLRFYYEDKKEYPWAGDATGKQQSHSVTGWVPYDDSKYKQPVLDNWLNNNGWYALTTYQVSTAFQPGTSYPQSCSSGCLTVRGVQVPAVVTVGGGSSIWSSRVCLPNAAMTECPDP